MVLDVVKDCFLPVQGFIKSQFQIGHTGKITLTFDFAGDLIEDDFMDFVVVFELEVLIEVDEELILVVEDTLWSPRDFRHRCS